MPRNTVPPEDLDRARAMIDDGASVMEITRTLGIARETILKNFPGASWSHRDAGSLGYAMRLARKGGVL